MTERKQMIKMKMNKIIAGVLAVLVLGAFTACGEKTNYSSPEESSKSNEIPTEPPAEPVMAAEDGPRLYIKDTTAAAGEIAEVTMAVENAELKWNMCGIHVTYDNRLQLQIVDEEEGRIRYKKGDASEYVTGSVGMIWKEEGLPDEVKSAGKGCLFYTEVFEGNYGLDGDIVTFYFKVPDDAESGTVYDIGFYYMDTDAFSNTEKDKSMDLYVFQNWKGGTVTVT